MPGFTLPLETLADVYFPALMKKLPVDWKQPQAEPEKSQYPDSFEPSELAGVPEPLCYFWSATVNKYHVETCKDIGGKVKDFVHKALSTIKQAVDMWRLQAKIKDLKIMAVSGIGAPGCLDGPELKDMVPFKTWIETESNAKAYVKAVAEGVSKCWKEWQGKVTCPGLPMWPAFAAFPLAMAPPMPNVPFPLMLWPSAMMAKMTQPQLKSAMVDALDGGVKDEDSDKQHVAIFDTIAFAVGLQFPLWLLSQQVMMVMGKGPVPTYAPPYVPVGPVVGGDNLPIPGHLAT